MTATIGTVDMDSVCQVQTGGILQASVRKEKPGSGELDISRMARHWELAANQGIRGFVVNGTTWGGHLLPLEERIAGIVALRQAVERGDIPESLTLITGTGSSNPDEAGAVITAARDNGLHGVLALPMEGHDWTYDGDPGWKQKAMDDLARGCMAASPAIALIPYHIPSLKRERGMPTVIEPRLLLRIPEKLRPVVVGPKDSEGSEKSFSGWHEVRRKGFDVMPIIGNCRFIARGLQLGGIGTISGMANIPAGLRIIQQIFEAHARRDYEAAARLQTEELNPLIEQVLAQGGIAKALSRYED